MLEGGLSLRLHDMLEIKLLKELELLCYLDVVRGILVELEASEMEEEHLWQFGEAHTLYGVLFAVILCLISVVIDKFFLCQ